MRSSNWRISGVLLAAALLCGCATYGKSVVSVNQSIVTQTPEAALAAMKRNDFADRDQVLYHLERGNLLRLAKRFEESNKEYETAKQMMEKLYTKSLTKAIGTVVVNDAISDYAGESYEKIQVLTHQALNYIALNDLDNAAVMARQLEAQLSEISDAKEDDDDKRAYRCDPYANYLAGMVFEAIDDWSAARVVYERAYSCYSESDLFKNSAPKGLKVALLRATSHEGLSDQLEKYRSAFAADGITNLESTNGKGELIFVLNEGFIVNKIEKSLRINALNPKGGMEMIKIALPAMAPENPHYLGRVVVRVGGRRYEAEMVEDIDEVARAALSDAMPGIKTRAIARAFVKANAAKETGKKHGGWAKFLTQVVGIATEVADTRSWRSLPHSVWVCRVIVPPGSHNLEVELLGRNGYSLGRKQFTNIEVKPGSKRFITERWASPDSLVAKAEK